MKISKLTKLGIGLAVGGAAGYGAHYGCEKVFSYSPEKIASQIVQIKDCAHELGVKAVMSLTIPNYCQNEFNDKTYSYASASGTEYLLPSSSMMLKQISYLPAAERTTTVENDLFDTISGVVGLLGLVVTTGALTQIEAAKSSTRNKLSTPSHS